MLGGDPTTLRYGDVLRSEEMPFDPDTQSVAHATLVTPASVLAGGDSIDTEDYPVRGTRPMR